MILFVCTGNENLLFKAWKQKRKNEIATECLDGNPLNHQPESS